MCSKISIILYMTANWQSTFIKYIKVCMPQKDFSVDGKKFHSKELLFSLQYVSQAGINLINMRKPLANSYNYITTE